MHIVNKLEDDGREKEWKEEDLYPEGTYMRL